MAPTASAPRDALREKQGRAGIGGGGGVRQRREQTKANLAMATAAKAAAEAAHRALAQARGAGEQQAPRRQQGRFQGAADAPTVSYTSLRQSKSMAQLTAGLTAEEWEQQKDAVLVLKRAVQFLNDSVPQPPPELFVKRAAAGDVHTLREWFGRVDMRGARAAPPLPVPTVADDRRPRRAAPRRRRAADAPPAPRQTSRTGRRT